MSEETCGHLIKGDPSRPCVLSAGHKTPGHKDKDQVRRALDHQKDYYRANKDARIAYADGYREAHREKLRLNQREYFTKHRRPLSSEGFAYAAVTTVRPGLLKLGSSKDLPDNIQKARRFLPDYEHARMYPGGMLLELRFLHKVFADRRRDGEWFEVTADEVGEAVRDLYEQLRERFEPRMNPFDACDGTPGTRNSPESTSRTSGSAS